MQGDDSFVKQIDEETIRTYNYTYQEPPKIIHRSTTRIIQAGEANKYKSVDDGLLKGWKSP